MTRDWVKYGQTFATVSGTVLMALTSAACGDSPPLGPIWPTVQKPTQVETLAEVKSVAIVPETSVLRLGQTREFSLALEFGDDGRPIPVALIPRWTSSDPSVVAMTPRGDATAAGSAVYANATGIGVATIEVIVAGHTATRQLRVVP